MKETISLRRRLFREMLLVCLFLFSAAVIFTWPLALHFREAIPCGSEPDGVALYQLFSAAWTAASIERNLVYWNAPFFYPFEGAFSWTEPQPVFCIAVSLLKKVFGSIGGYNLAILLYMTAFGAAIYLGARLFTEDRLAAFFPALWCCAGAFSMQQICAPALLAGAFPVLTLIFAFLSFRNKRPFFFWAAVCAYLLTWGSCKQTALYLTMLLPVALSGFFSWRMPRMRTVLRWVLALAVIAAAIIPYSLWQLKLTERMGFERFISGVRGVLYPEQLFMPAKGHWLTSRILAWTTYSWDIGIAVLLIIVLGLCVGVLRFFSSWDTFRKKCAAGLFFMSALAFFLAFGPRADITIGDAKFGLYQVLFSFVPGFKFIRAPARILFFTIAGCAILAAPVFSFVRSKVKQGFSRRVFSAACFGVLIAEIWVIPLPLIFPGISLSRHEGVDSWMKKHSGGKPLFELPAPVRLWPDNTVYEVEAMLRSLRHGSPVVNGYASFAPSSYWQLRKALESDAAGLGKRYLEAYAVHFILLHTHRSDEEELHRLRKAFDGRIVYEDDGHQLYELVTDGRGQAASETLPRRVIFPGKPEVDKVYALSLPQKRKAALLFAPGDDAGMEAVWRGEDGSQHAMRLTIAGAALIDTAHSKFYLRIAGYRKDNEVRAVILPAEEIEALFLRKAGEE